MKRSLFLPLFICTLMGIVITACTDDEQGTTPPLTKPEIVFDNGTGVYQVKIGAEITIAPIVKNAVAPLFQWEQNGEIVGTDREYTFKSHQTGSNYLTLLVDAKNGTVKEEVRIDVLEKMTPAISLPIPEGGLIAYTGIDLPLAATVLNHTNATYEWRVNNEIASADSLYLFNRQEAGEYTISLTVTNEDGSDNVAADIQVIPTPPFSVQIETPSLTIPLGRTAYLKACPSYPQETPVGYQWLLNGKPQTNITGDSFELTPMQTGEEYVVKVVANDGRQEVTTEATITCIAAEGTHYRAATGSSSPYSDRVYQFLPAPGQFINQCRAKTQVEANQWATAALASHETISLGGFGGYIVVGFDHSIDNRPNEYDFGIEGNSFDNSSEPGIVWVMQDENGDGLPNDTWYELRGSESGKPETRQHYSVTYYKPKTDGVAVVWRDEEGKSGSLNLTPHYPAWITLSSYSLSGVLLQSKVTQDPSTGLWDTGNYNWGYVDNFGSDRLSNESNSQAGPNCNYFKLENTTSITGQPITLSYIDFVKVQVGIHVQAGWLGELSTEVCSFKEYKSN